MKTRRGEKRKRRRGRRRRRRRIILHLYTSPMYLSDGVH